MNTHDSNKSSKKGFIYCTIIHWRMSTRVISKIIGLELDWPIAFPANIHTFNCCTPSFVIESQFLFRNLRNESRRRLIHMCDNFIDICKMTHFYTWHDSFICVTWLISTHDMTHSFAWHDSFLHVTQLIHMRDMTHFYTWHDSFICVTWLIFTWRTHVYLLFFLGKKKVARCSCIAGRQIVVAWGTTHMSKETVMRDKRDLDLCQKKPTSKKTCVHIYLRHGMANCRDVCICMYVWQKRPRSLSKEAYIERDLHIYISEARDGTLLLRDVFFCVYVCVWQKRPRSLSKEAYIQRDLYTYISEVRVCCVRSLYVFWYEVASISRLLKSIGLFCKRAI